MNIYRGTTARMGSQT